MQTNSFAHIGHHVEKADSVDSVISPMTESAGSPFILCHELDGSGKVIRSIGLDAGMLELISVTIAVLVFWKIMRFVFGDD